jgi:hypothetical protein
MKTPFVLIALFLLSGPPFSGQEKKPVPPPTALCTAGVPPSECKEITSYLSEVQQSTMATQMIQFVIADTAAYKAEKERASTIAQNSPVFEQPYLFAGGVDSFYEVNEGTGALLLRKVYFNESSACHLPVIEAGKTSETRFGDYSMLLCTPHLFYVFGFVNGAFSGSVNATNRMSCATDAKWRDGKFCSKR